MSDTKLVNLLRDQLKDGHNVLEMTFEGTEESHAHFKPGGTANPVGATYLHLVMSEDMLVNSFLMHRPTLMESTFADKTGASAPMPAMGEEWATYPTWTQEVTVDIPQAREYAKAVYENTDEYLASLTDEDLDKDIDTSSMGMDSMKLVTFISGFIIAHTGHVTGEIAALKGIQGLKGYPF